MFPVGLSSIHSIIIFFFLSPLGIPFGLLKLFETRLGTSFNHLYRNSVGHIQVPGWVLLLITYIVTRLGFHIQVHGWVILLITYIITRLGVCFLTESRLGISLYKYHFLSTSDWHLSSFFKVPLSFSYMIIFPYFHFLSEWRS